MENVVLYDILGIGEWKVIDDVVIEFCKFVDVIVVVMDIYSFSLRIVSNILLF